MSANVEIKVQNIPHIASQRLFNANFSEYLRIKNQNEARNNNQTMIMVTIGGSLKNSRKFSLSFVRVHHLTSFSLLIR
jgi:hypothetical protein